MSQPEEKPVDIMAIAMSTMNEMLRLDPAACNELLTTRVKALKALSDHPFIQVSGTTDASLKVGFLGTLNGILEKATGKRLVIVVDDGPKVVGFQSYTPTKE